MAKYTKTIVERIVKLVKTDTFTIEEICARVGISRRLWYQWRDDHPEFVQALEDAERDRMEMFVLEAKKSLLKKVKGYDVQETKVTTIPSGKTEADGKTPIPKIKEQITTTKHIAPDTGAIIFVLTNGDPDHWKNRQNAELTGANGEPLVKPARILTKKEAKEFMKQLEDEV
jgi:transposase-like protein